MKNSQNRRSFIKRSALVAASAFAGLKASGKAMSEKQTTKITRRFEKLTELTKPVAIAMWDFSWLLRHHKIGEFEHFDRVLDELVERGYNAIRMDAFPQFVASDGNGNIQERFYHPKEDWKPALWGNNYSMYSEPRKSLAELLSKCNDRNISIGLSTWFLGHGTQRNLEFEGVNGLVRAWDETLLFLDNNGLLKNILYVDVLNEYPLWHGFDWLKMKLDSMSDKTQYLENNPDAHIADADFIKSVDGKFNRLQENFYRNFISSVLLKLKAKWPQLNFFASVTKYMHTPWEEADFTGFEGLDSHIWLTHYYDFGMSSGYFENVHTCSNDLGFEKTQKAMKAYWAKHKPKIVDWMDDELGKREELARKQNLVCGNTEGWGPINWYEHPLLDWEFTKEAGEICVDLALKHNFKFICTSNFTHPQFKGIWEDIEWHKRLTNKIKNG